MYCANLDHFLIRWSPDVYEGTYNVDQVMIAKTTTLVVTYANFIFWPLFKIIEADIYRIHTRAVYILNLYLNSFTSYFMG